MQCPSVRSYTRAALCLGFCVLAAACSLDRASLGAGELDGGPTRDANLDALFVDVWVAPVDAAGDAARADVGPPDAGADAGPCDRCGAGTLCCGLLCVDPTSDLAHCGACDSPCPVAEHSTPVCSMSACDVVCEAGWDDCDVDPRTGCEADLSSVATCGSCGVACPVPAHASATCGAGGCGIACEAGWDDCDTDTTTGCEASLSAVTSCGACGVVCPGATGATPTCDGSGCGLVCVAGFSDCDGAAGCESVSATDPLNCGGCGNVCAPGRVCSAGACVGWTDFSTTGVPAARYDHSAVWTGTEMIVWGGEGASATLANGAAYNPASDTWRAISNTGAPTARRGATAIWTGTEMVIWGGYADATSFVSTGAAYDPVANTWRTLSNASAPSTRSRVPGVWSGSQMLIWGGWGGSGARDDGARWAASNTWSAITGTGAPSSRRWNAAVWTGTRLLVWGGEAPGVTREDGGVYDPIGDAWSAMVGSGPTGRSRMAHVFTTGLPTPMMVVWGGDRGTSGGVATDSLRSDGGRYAPTGWRAMAASPLSARSFCTGVWTGTQMLVWGGQAATAATDDGAGYDPVADTWVAMRSAGSPGGRSRHTAVWTGTEMIVFGGLNGSGAVLGTGGRYRP